MGNSFRPQPGPTIYYAKSPVTENVLQVGLLFAFGMIAVSFIVIIPGIRGWERLWASIRVFVALWIGAVLLVCNYGSWYADSVCTRTPYKAHTKPNSPQLIQAVVGLSISLRGINVTLAEMEDGCGAEEYESPFPDENILYEESFHWAPSWSQGRIDFGKFGGQFRQEYREHQYRGTPDPIMRVAEPFLFDGDQFVWYRKFRIAGWYTHIGLWCGFATYLLSILLFVVSISHGARLMLITGAMLCLAPFSYSILIQNDPPLKIPFQDAVLKPTFDYSFYLTLITGVFTVLNALIIMIMHWIWPRKVAKFFHHSFVDDDEEVDDVLRLSHKTSKTKGPHGRRMHRKVANIYSHDSIRVPENSPSERTFGRSDITLHKVSPKADIKPISQLVASTATTSVSGVQLEMATVHNNS